MNLSELRIGNLVWENYGGIYIVREIREKEVVLSKTKTTIAVGYKNSEVKGIELTEEWLMNLGFETQKNNFNDNFKLNDECSVKFETDESEKGWWYSNDSSDAYCFRLRKIEYVHQLQNLYFALTAKELTL